MGNKIRMPSGMAGLTRFDEQASRFTLTPGSVVILAAVVILIVVILHLFGLKMLGLS